MAKIVDISGQKFGRLTAIKRIGKDKHGHSLWECKCDCNNIINLPIYKLTTGNTKSCGCLHREIVKNIGHNNKKYNKYDLSGEYGIGYTNKGEEFYFDLEDYDKIKDICWFLINKDYVAGLLNKKFIFMHDYIMNKKDLNLQVDHIHKPRTNNRKNNLRIVTPQENAMNHGTYKNNTSGYSGVTWHKGKEQWQARIGYKNKRINLGYFDKLEDAIKARKEAEIKYYGEFRFKGN